MESSNSKGLIGVSCKYVTNTKNMSVSIETVITLNKVIWSLYKGYKLF